MEFKLKDFFKSVLIILICIFVSSYTILACSLLFDVWFNTSLILSGDIVEPEHKFNFNAFISCIAGAILGGAILSITSIHRHLVISKNFECIHSYGYFLNPVLTTITGVLAYSLFHGSFIFLTGNNLDLTTNSAPPYGFAAFGFVFGYNWDVTIKLLESLSKKIKLTGSPSK